MIETAKTFPPDDEPIKWRMVERIRESWYSSDCPLCQNYNCRFFSRPEINPCPLYLRYGNCEDEDAGNNWLNVVFATTWRDWIREAEIFLNQLKSLRKEGEKC
jgi:hypothetical protein